MVMAQAQKGFTLIELLVVVAIIGILAAVGVVSYNGYSTGTKKNVSKIIHSQTVRFLSAEIAICSLLEDSIIMKKRISCGFQDGEWNACDSDDCKAQMLIDELDVFEDKNPYDSSERAVTAIETDLGYTVVYNRTDHLEIKTQWNKDESISPLVNYIYFDETTGTPEPDEPKFPTIVQTKRGCPSGWSKELHFCVAGPDARPIVQTKSGCPSGWSKELHFCVAEDSNSPTIVQTKRGCPSGWTKELHFCVEEEPNSPEIVQTKSGCPSGWSKELHFCVAEDSNTPTIVQTKSGCPSGWTKELHFCVEI